ncbi:hypothetical protein C8J56DRAFT_896577 [Mycena floridula]|nr:hypothetical protein C8J56DRAFT_896577 [Mycena floridula]
MAPSSTNSLSPPSEPPVIPESSSATLSPAVLTPLNLNNEKGANPANCPVQTASQAASAKFAEQLAPTATSGKGKQPLAPSKPPPKSTVGSVTSSLKSSIMPKWNVQGNNVPLKAKIGSQSNLKKPEDRTGNLKQALSPMQGTPYPRLLLTRPISSIGNQRAEDPPYARGDMEEVESLIQDHSVLSYHLNDVDAPVYQPGGPLYYLPIFLGVGKHIKVMREPLLVSIGKNYNLWMQVLGVEDPLKFIEYPFGPPEKTRGYFSAEMLLKTREILTRVHVQPRDKSVNDLYNAINHVLAFDFKEERMVTISVNDEVQYQLSYVELRVWAFVFLALTQIFKTYNSMFFARNEVAFRLDPDYLELLSVESVREEFGTQTRKDKINHLLLQDRYAKFAADRFHFYGFTSTSHGFSTQQATLPIEQQQAYTKSIYAPSNIGDSRPKDSKLPPDRFTTLSMGPSNIMNSTAELTNDTHMMDKVYLKGFFLSLRVLLVEVCQTILSIDKLPRVGRQVGEEILPTMKIEETIPTIRDCLMEDFLEQRLTVLPIEVLQVHLVVTDHQEEAEEVWEVWEVLAALEFHTTCPMVPMIPDLLWDQVD